MIRKNHNHKLKTNLWHREEEPHNNHETPGLDPGLKSKILFDMFHIYYSLACMQNFSKKLY